MKKLDELTVALGEVAESIELQRRALRGVLEDALAQADRSNPESVRAILNEVARPLKMHKTPVSQIDTILLSQAVIPQLANVWEDAPIAVEEVVRRINAGEQAPWMNKSLQAMARTGAHPLL